MLATNLMLTKTRIETVYISVSHYVHQSSYKVKYYNYKIKFKDKLSLLEN